MLQSTTVVKAAANQVSSDIGGETAILNLKNGTYYGLNPVGTRIWALIQEPCAVESICQTLLAEYDVEPARCEREVLALLQRLAEAGLVEVQHVAIG